MSNNAADNQCQPTTAGYTEAEGYAASIRQIAKWIDDADLGGEYDTDELRAASDLIARQSVRIEELKADNEGLRKALNAVSVPADVRKLNARIEELEAAQEQFISDLASSVNEISATDRQKEVFKASLRYAITHARRLAADRAALPQSSGVARTP